MPRAPVPASAVPAGARRGMDTAHGGLILRIAQQVQSLQEGDRKAWVRVPGIEDGPASAAELRVGQEGFIVE